MSLGGGAKASHCCAGSLTQDNMRASLRNVMQHNISFIGIILFSQSLAKNKMWCSILPCMFVDVFIPLEIQSILIKYENVTPSIIILVNMRMDNIKERECINLDRHLVIMDKIKDREQVLLFINGFEKDSNAAMIGMMMLPILDLWPCCRRHLALSGRGNFDT